MSKVYRKRVTPQQVEEMFFLRYHKGLSNADIAQHMNLHYLTVLHHIGPQPAVMTEIYRTLSWEHRAERRMIAGVIVKELEQERIQREEQQRAEEMRKQQERIDFANQVIQRRMELNRRREEALAALSQLESEMNQLQPSVDESEQILASIAIQAKAL